MNILVVDDEAVMVESIKIGLESKGYRVFEAVSAQQALDHLYHGGHRIDLVATDYLMPAMNGIDLLEAIRGSHPTLPVIIMTAYAQTSLVIEALRNGCDSFIEKPFSLDQLVAEIQRIQMHLLRNTRSSDLHKFFPGLVHQINNFLMAITGFAELILLDRSNGDDLQKYVESILAAVKQIGRINKDVMDAGRREEGKYEPVELDALLDGCLGMFQGMFILKGVRVEREIPAQGLRVLGDRLGLEQVFNNLILNAVDAMDDRLEKTLRVTAAAPQGPASIEVTVEDTGCGIRQECMNKIFEPYFTGKSQGNGLGLAVVKNVVEKHGGKILVRSRMGNGSKFSVHFPAARMD